MGVGAGGVGVGMGDGRAGVDGCVGGPSSKDPSGVAVGIGAGAGVAVGTESSVPGGSGAAVAMVVGDTMEWAVGVEIDAGAALLGAAGGAGVGSASRAPQPARTPENTMANVWKAKYRADGILASRLSIAGDTITAVATIHSVEMTGTQRPGSRSRAAAPAVNRFGGRCGERASGRPDPRQRTGSPLQEMG